MLHILIPVVSAKKTLTTIKKLISCSNCKHWIHIKCNGTSVTEYNQMIDDNSTLTEVEIDDLEWFCNKCQILKTAQIFPFGLEDTNEVLNMLTKC